MRLASLFPLLGFAATPAYSRPSPSFQDNCVALASKIHLNYDFTVNIVQYLPPNGTIDYKAEGMNETCLTASVAYPIPMGVCRLNLRVQTTAHSEIYMEVWLPEKWTGRVMTTGNGGLAGCIQYGELAYGTSYGFASFGTNAGHNGTSGGAFFHQPDVVEDFSWRAVYTGTVVGKAITKQFYGRDCGKSYYIGCSSGGRQGWKAVQQNPELFDGVIAGAPAFDFFAHLAWFGYAFETLGFNTSSVSATQWEAVQNEVMKQCDGLDGAHDGILEDPTACKFDWKPLLCSAGSNSSNCLTPAQVNSAAKLFAPISYEGTFLDPGHLHGYETTLIAYLYTSLVQGWITEGYRYVVYQNLDWNPSTLSLKDAVTALQANPSNLQTFDADISAFRDRGGKIMHWHGTADPLLSPAISNLYYTKVQQALKASVADLDHFYRYFRASGVGHCAGGPGANRMGQMSRTGAGDDPDDNMLMRIVEWVEKGHAPEYVRGTKYVNDTAALGVEFKRKHCRYPKVNVYKGSGNGTDEEGWRCVEPRR